MKCRRKFIKNSLFCREIIKQHLYPASWQDFSKDLQVLDMILLRNDYIVYHSNLYAQRGVNVSFKKNCLKDMRPRLTKTLKALILSSKSIKKHYMMNSFANS